MWPAGLQGGLLLLLLAAACALSGTPPPVSKKAVVWAPCGDSKGLSAASNWDFASGQLQLVAAAGAGAPLTPEEEGLCLTQPGKSNTKGRGEALVLAACNPANAGQRWGLNRSMLQLEAAPSAAPVCVAPYQFPGPPLPTAAAYPCPTGKPTWDFALEKLAGSGALGATKLQMHTPRGNICLSYDFPAGHPPGPPPPAAPVPLPTAAQARPSSVLYQDYHMLP